MIIALALPALASPAASPVGHYHPADLSPLSQVFLAASEHLTGPFEKQSSAIERYAGALRQYREALDLLGPQAAPAERERLAALEKDYHRQEAILQAFADDVVDDFDTQMRAAVERALVSLGEVQRCIDQIPDGPQVPGLRPRSKDNPECVGPNRNQQVATAMDADALLARAVDGLLARAWPEVTLPSEPQAPTDGAGRWLLVRHLLVAGARDQLRAIDNADDEARMEIGAALEQDDVDPAALKARVDQIAADTAAARSAFAAPLLSLALERAAKWKGEPAVGLCANPRLLGGCTGDDASSELVGRLLDDKKLAKALPAQKR